MSLTDIAKVDISLSGPAPSQASFSNMLLLAYHTGPKLLESYTSLGELEADGHGPETPVWKMAASAFSQAPPTPSLVYVGRRDNAFSQTVDIFPINLTVGHVYSFKLVLPDGVTIVDITYTVQNGDDADDICTGLMTSLGTQTGMTFTQHASTLTPVTPATITGTVDLLMLDVTTLNTQTFIVSSNLGGPYTTTFTAVATVDDIADQINAVTTTNATASIFEDAGKAYLRMESFTIGVTGTLLLGSGTANDDLGFTDAATATGTSTPATAASISLASSAAGAIFDLKELPLPVDLKVSDLTADPGVVTDIAAIYVADPTNWYAVALDQSGEATIEALAVWIEANEKVFVYQTSDTACSDSTSTTDVMPDLKLLSYARTFGKYCANRLHSYGEVGWTAAMLSAPGFPGTAAWFYRTIVGEVPDVLTSSQDHAIVGIGTAGTSGKNGNIYVTQNSLGITKGGRVAVGEWIDVIVGRDALKARIQESVFSALKKAADNASKVPFTDFGIGLIQSAILTPLNVAATPQPDGSSFLTPGSQSVTVPKASAVSSTDKANRRLTGVTFTAQIAGAIYATVITGSLTT
jgi:hypothetical protein